RTTGFTGPPACRRSSRPCAPGVSWRCGRRPRTGALPPTWGRQVSAWMSAASVPTEDADHATSYGLPNGRRAGSLAHPAAPGRVPRRGWRPASAAALLVLFPAAAGAGIVAPHLGTLVADGARRHHLARSEEHTSELQSRENLVC